MNSARVNVTAVLLPDGKVLILGGHEKYKRNHDNTHPSNVAEIYDPTVSYDVADPSAAFTEVAEMHKPRLYHSVALLLPDGRVFVAGGEDNETEGNQKTMEFYEPPYLHQGNQQSVDLQ